MRRFPPPWTVEALDGGFKIVAANGQTLAYVYGHADQRDAQVAKALTLDEARRIAANIAKLPTLLGKPDEVGFDFIDQIGSALPIDGLLRWSCAEPAKLFLPVPL